MGLVNKLATKFHQHGKCENPAFSPSFCRLWLETSCRQCCTSGGSVPICACATYKSTLGTFSSAVLKCLRSWRNLISTPLETQTQSFFSCPHPHSILPYARVRAVNISTLWWLQDFCSQATGQAARGETWPLPASDLSVASLFLISAGRHHLLFQYFINNDCLSKQQCNYRGWIYHVRVINVRPDAAACDLMGPAVTAPRSGISWISVVSLFAASLSSSPLFCAWLG